MRHRSARPGSPTAWLLFLFLLAGAPACKSGDASRAGAPSLANLALSPTSAGMNEGGGTVSVGFTVDLSDSEADINELTVTVLDTGGAEVSKVSGDLQNPPGVTSGTLQGSIGVPTTAIATYTLRFQIFDARHSASNVLEGTFSVVAGAPAPVLAALSPSSAEAGSGDLTLTATGSGFTTASVVFWNGSYLSTTFVDAGTLRASVPSYWISGVGTAQVSVVTPAPGGGTSGAMTFTITAPAPRPAPVLTSISPSSADAGGTQLTVTVSGNGFVPSSTVLFNGSWLATTFVDGSTLQAALAVWQLSSVGSFPITVTNPAPGGGSSNALSFVVRVPPQPGVTVVSLKANDVVWDPYQQRLYLSVPSSSSVNPNTITVLDPFTGLLGASQFGGSEPGPLALSDDGQFLYVGLGGASEVSRFSLPGLAPDLAIPLGRDPSAGVYIAKDLSVAPGAPHTVAVSMSTSYYSSGATAVFDDATARSSRSGGSGAVRWGGTAGTLFATGSVWADLLVYPVDGAGLGTATTYHNAFSNSSRLEFDPGTGLVYGVDGRAVDPATGFLVGTYSTGYYGSAMVPDSSLGSAFFAASSSYGSWLELRTFDLTHFTTSATTTLPYVAGPASRVARWGPDGVAILTSGNVVLIRGPAVRPEASSPNPAPALVSLSPASVASGSGNLRLRVTGTGFVPGSVVQWNGADRSTRRVSSTELDAYVPASDLASAGTASITVSNPGPGGGLSSATTFAVSP